MSAVNTAYRGEEGPLIVMRDAAIVEEDAVAVATSVLLQRHGDQIAEPSLRQRVLVREEAIVRIEPDVRPTFHRLGQDVGAELSRERSGHGLFEEQPHVAAPPRTRPLKCRRQIHPAARLNECS